MHAVPSKTSVATKRKASLDHEDTTEAKKHKKSISSESFSERLEHIVVAHRMKILPPKDIKYFIRHWRYDLDETMSFYKYYDEDNSNQIDTHELDKSDCIEFLHRQSCRFYGSVQSQRCKECSYEDEKTVYHCL